MRLSPSTTPKDVIKTSPKTDFCSHIALALLLLLCGLAKADETDLAWSTFLSGGAYDQGYGIAVDDSGSVYVLGHTRSSRFPATYGAFDTTHNGGQDVFVVKINPTGSLLEYATLLGGSSDEYGYGIALDSGENVHITGHTKSTDFPTTARVFDKAHGGAEDVFVAKLSLSGSALEYATLLGGSLSDIAYGIAVDAHGQAHITGYTMSADFPSTAEAFDNIHNGKKDIFVAKLNAGGTALLYSSFLGGSEDDDSRDIALDQAGNAHIIGQTQSTDFPTTTGTFDTTHSGIEDAVVAKFNPTGSGLLYATFLGGSSFEKGSGIALDGTGNAYLTGYTMSTDFPATAGTFDSTHNGNWDVFAAKLNPMGNALVYATLLGGSSYEKGFDIALDSAGNACVTGYTWSADFPTTASALDSTHNGGEDIYVVKLNSRGTALLYATFLGGRVYDASHGIAVGSSGNAYITGNTWSADFPVTAGAYNTIHRRYSSDAFVAKLNLGGASRLLPETTVTRSPGPGTRKVQD
jgi:hypothetical protein